MFHLRGKQEVNKMNKLSFIIEPVKTRIAYDTAEYNGFFYVVDEKKTCL